MSVEIIKMNLNQEEPMQARYAAYLLFLNGSTGIRIKRKYLGINEIYLRRKLNRAKTNKDLTVIRENINTLLARYEDFNHYYVDHLMIKTKKLHKIAEQKILSYKKKNKRIRRRKKNLEIHLGDIQ